MIRFYKILSFVGVIILLQFIFSTSAHAASLTGVSDTITTSRSSASAPLASNVAANATQATITTLTNNSIFLASDSARFQNDTGETIDTGIIVASSSAITSNQRTVYFTGGVVNTHHAGDAVYTPITAMHTIAFKPQASVPTGGKIVLTFPTSNAGDSNQASPSAATFMPNGLINTNVVLTFSSGTTTATCTSSFSAGSALVITCTTATAAISSGVTVRVFVGCSAASGAACTTQVPTLINPTKSNNIAGQADTWKIAIKTQDASSIDLDSAKAAVATVESVQVQAQVDPTLTFTIAATTNGTAINNSYVTGCPAAASEDTTNTGIDTTAQFVNMGIINSNLINVAAQKLTVSTNATGGYTITATSSGKLQNPGSGYAFSSSTGGQTLTAGTEGFGIWACGTNANAGLFVATRVTNAGGGKVAWPTQATAITIGTSTTQVTTDNIAVEYAGTASGTTPAGIYTSVITYTVTPTFN